MTIAFAHDTASLLTAIPMAAVIHQIMESKMEQSPGQKNKSAVALKYQQGEESSTPTVIAKGFGDLAEEIINIAKQSGVLVHEDPYLSDFLATLDLGQEIPEQLYHVIAELIAFSYVLQGKFPASWAKQFGKISAQA